MRYPGGKGKCYQHLINLMPKHRTYIESHLGGGAVMRHKLPALRNIGIELDREVVRKWKESATAIEVVHDDALQYLSAMTFDGSELIYADPPYIRSTRRGGAIYKHEYEQADHLRLLDLLCELPCMVMISGYANQLYDERLAGWRTHTFMAQSHAGVRQEMVWMNFPPPTALHDARFLGDSFRERQAIQRRAQTLRRRLSALATSERAELIRWMAETFQNDFQEALCK